MNNVNLIGRITNNLELKTIGTGKVVNFSVAVNNKDKATFINVTAFNQVAENLCKYQKKGSQIGITGYLQDNNYKDKNGNNIYTLKVMANSIEYLGGVKANEKVEFSPSNEFSKQEPIRYELDNEDIPF